MNETIYCVEVNVNATSAKEWRRWMEEVHIPDMLETGLFRGARLYVRPDVSTEEKVACEIHYRTTQQELEAYQNNHAARLQADHLNRFEGKFEAKRRILHLGFSINGAKESSR
jgi:hypothetical protein